MEVRLTKLSRTSAVLLLLGNAQAGSMCYGSLFFGSLVAGQFQAAG